MPVANDRLAKLQVLKLIQAVRDKDHEQIRKLVDQGLPDLVNFSESMYLQTGIHLAASSNDVETINLLMSLGADCNKQDKFGETPFIKAAKYGHIQALTSLLDSCKRPDLAVKDVEGNHILYHCLHATKRHQLCLEIALRYGADVHSVSENGKPLLIKACEQGLEKSVKTLLQAGCDVNKQCEPTKESALHFVCLYGYNECARHLLKYNADPNISDKDGKYPLHYAASKDNINMLRILSAYKADFNVSSRTKDTPMHFAAEKGFGAICKFLGQRDLPAHIFSAEFSLQMYLDRFGADIISLQRLRNYYLNAGNLKSVGAHDFTCLMKKGCLANIKNEDGMLPKHVAKANSHKKVVKECIKCERLKRNKPGTELHIVKFYDWLLENKEAILLDIKSYDPEVNGKTTGKIGKKDLMLVLQAHIAPLGEKDLEKVFKGHGVDSLIDYELFFSGKKFINKQFLVDGGVKREKSSRKKSGKKKKTVVDTPICINVDQTRNKNGGPLVSYMKKLEQRTDHTRFNKDHPPEHPIQDDSFWYSYQPDPAYIHVREVIKYNDKESLKHAINKGFDINHQDKFYKTPLMSACIEGNIEIVKYLLAEGANVNVVDNFKWTALHFACHAGQQDIAEILLNNGALLDAKSLNGGTPIMRAIESSRENIIKFLISKGAKIQVENKKGQTALDIAKAYGDPRIIHLVQSKWDALPPLPGIGDKRKRDKMKKSGKKSTSSSRLSMPNIRSTEQLMEQDLGSEDRSKSRSSGKLSSVRLDGQPSEKTISYQPKQAWLPEANTDELLKAKKVKRDRFGYEIDFEDYKPAYQKHVSNLVEKLVLDDKT